MAIKTIIVALAFEQDCQHIAGRAVQLANEHNAQLIGVHVLEGIDTAETWMPSSLELDALTARITDENRQRLSETLSGTKIPAMLHVATGKPFAVIEDLAVSHNADVIIIGAGVARTHVRNFSAPPPTALSGAHPARCSSFATSTSLLITMWQSALIFQIMPKRL